MFVIVKRSDQNAVTLAELSRGAPATTATFADELLAEMKAHELLCHCSAGRADGERFEVMTLAKYQHAKKALAK